MSAYSPLILSKRYRGEKGDFYKYNFIYLTKSGVVRRCGRLEGKCVAVWG